MKASLHPRIKHAQEVEKRAHAYLCSVVKDVQAKCPHEVVIERAGGNPYRYLDAYYHAQRVCPTCGLWEEEHNWGQFKHLPDRPNREVSKQPVTDSLYHLRVDA